MISAQGLTHRKHSKEATYFNFHVTDVETETQRGQVICSRSHSMSGAKLDLKSVPREGTDWLLREREVQCYCATQLQIPSPQSKLLCKGPVA